MQLFSAFVENPQQLNFQNQEPDENIRLFLRKHFVTNLSWLLLVSILSLLPLLLPALLPMFQDALFMIPGRYIITLILFYYLIVFGYVFTSFISWFYNVGLITSRRVIDLEFSNISYKNIQTTLIADVKDAEFTQQGFLQSFFDYGDVTLQIEAEATKFIFEKVPHPSQVVEVVLDLLDKNKNA